MQSNIIIEGLKLFAYHGVFEQERIVGNTFEINAKLYFNAEKAMMTDNIDLSANYAAIIEMIKEEMSIPSNLLENVVYRIYRRIERQFPIITGGSITLYKQHPPIEEEVDRVGFSFSW
ncbi:MAG: dihydroneopterin aldolase [Muribaculaceae bacterium]|nr:dihydroneopterin aldolase [Muribaculaceae bacterium]